MTDLARRAALPLLLTVAVMATPAAAQTAANPQAARESGAAIVVDAQRELDTVDASATNAPPPAARGRRGTRLRSQNDLYNLGRIAEGRVGVRVGSDMSYRVEKRAGEP